MKGIVIDINDITDSREVMESKESPKIRWFIYILIIIIAAAVIFACFFEIDEYTKATGEIKTQKASSSVMSPSNCKIKEICIDEGQNVKTGDILFVLDSDYAAEQKSILEEKLNSYHSDLTNTELLKKCIEDDVNYFKNNNSDSKYYYRYEQYKNGVSLTAREIDASQLNNSLTAEEKENNLTSTEASLTAKQKQLLEYSDLLTCVKNNSEYSGSDELIKSSYAEYNANYEKALFICKQYKDSYENLSKQYTEQFAQETITSVEVETVKQKSETAYSNMISYQSAYLSDVRSQILLIENQLISDSGNSELQAALNSYKELKNAVEQGYEFNANDSNLQNSYEQYIAEYVSLADEYNARYSEYQDLYSKFMRQNSSTIITEASVNEARYAYESAKIDADVLKNSFITQLQTQISTLKDEIKTLESNKKSLELSLEGVEDLKEYEKLSGEKLKNEAVITLNSEIDSINENITSVESQLIEVNTTIKNSEVTATFDGTVTLVNELNPGDVVQAGSQLCSVIPTGEELKVMLYIPENEISKIEIGQKTEYVFDAIPYNEYGKITGEITSISADSIVDESSGTKFYIAQADLSALSLKNSEGNIREVKNGMMVEAKTISGSKKAIVWLLEKINFMD
ncbi:HlyD family efflux transporter periplasmic adaptor subunit [Ruminococcus sp. Marseille-P6503]|uniref:HlyD family efflux transporter periplasmic adaptor subunit n=1 Tax=Ruminococcus sp. Marseille-P6503 TaxID=2364796 RepID=UPI000F51D9D3|nr:HlyD family efflux transporter periplasmic adaptor subunit [Ruminococcus sp. Marseille-P6503]